MLRTGFVQALKLHFLVKHHGNQCTELVLVMIPGSSLYVKMGPFLTACRFSRLSNVGNVDGGSADEARTTE